MKQAPGGLLNSLIKLVVFSLTIWLIYEHGFKNSDLVQAEWKTAFRPNLIKGASISVDDSGVSIPRIIHQTWSNYSIPFMYKDWIKSCQSYNTRWQYWFWTDNDIHQLIKLRYPAFLPTFDAYPSNGYRADAFRYFVLYEFGGIYLDLDIQCLKALDPLIESDECFLSQEPLEHAVFLGPVGAPLISNAVMGCRPQHPFFRKIINSLDRTPGWLSGWKDILYATGPYKLTQELREYEKSTSSNQVRVASPSEFLPTIDASMVDPIRSLCMRLRVKSWWQFFSSGDEQRIELCQRLMGFQFSNIPAPESYTDHHWTHSWASAKHDPWGVKNSRIFFTMQEILGE